MFRLFVLGLLLLGFGGPMVVAAQGFASDFGTPEFSLILDPTHPEPGEIVTVSLDDYAGGAFGAQVAWRYNGEFISDSLNKRKIEIPSGPLGSRQMIEAILTLPSGGRIVIDDIIRPVYLDIIVEPQTRVPDWYPGRSVPSLGSMVNVTALVNDGSFISPQNAVYTWQVNQTILEGGPLRGRNKISFATPRGRHFILSVTATEPGGDIIASRAFQVASVMPELAFYEQHSLYGSQIYPIDSSVNLIGGTLTVKAEPFFLDTRVYNNPDITNWEINGLQTDNGSRNPYQITLQRNNTSGQTDVNFHVRSLQEVLQGAEDNIAINF